MAASLALSTSQCALCSRSAGVRVSLTRPFSSSCQGARYGSGKQQQGGRRPRGRLVIRATAPKDSAPNNAPQEASRTSASTTTNTNTSSSSSTSSSSKGLFGTSWAFGFTKQNELFVGRVAMLGFAASLLGEAITGSGILAQLHYETGIPVYEAEPMLLFFVLFNMMGAVGALGDRGEFVDGSSNSSSSGSGSGSSSSSRMPAAVKPPMPPKGATWKEALGLNEDGPTVGFTKSNELFVGRLAQLGFAASLIGEVITGKGALAQLNIETGVPVAEIEPLVILGIMLLVLAAINPGTGKFINDDDVA